MKTFDQAAPKPDGRLFTAVMLLASLAFVIFAVRQSAGLANDDAFITYRYARNIASGQGFVFNPGERLLGTTTPLYTLSLVPVALLA